MQDARIQVAGGKTDVSRAAVGDDVDRIDADPPVEGFADLLQAVARRVEHHHLHAGPDCGDDGRIILHRRIDEQDLASDPTRSGRADCGRRVRRRGVAHLHPGTGGLDRRLRCIRVQRVVRRVGEGDTIEEIARLEREQAVAAARRFGRVGSDLRGHLLHDPRRSPEEACFRSMSTCAGRLGICSQAWKRATAGANRPAPGFSGVMRRGCSAGLTRGAACIRGVRNDV